MHPKIIEPLPRQEVINAIERRHPSRVPLVRAKWWGEGLREQYGERLATLEGYPEDVLWLFMENPASPAHLGLSWSWETEGAHDTRVVIDDWNKLDEFIAKLPRPEQDDRFEMFLERLEAARDDGRYRLFGWWRLFFEMPWQLRGMENLMVDYYTAPDSVHRLHTALCDVYCAYIEYACRVLKPDGFFSSDDLGHQTGPMMSPRIFHIFQFPYYQRLGRLLHERGLHFWLHSCGDNTLLLPDLVEAGLDVFHPVQKHTMDERDVATRFGDRLSFLAGIDVQHTLQEKGPDGVREEVHFLVDTFDRQGGGMILAAGNGIVAGTPFENIEAFLDEGIRYGTAHRQMWNGQSGSRE